MTTDESKVSAVVRTWTNEIAASRKRDKEYRKEGERIRAIYAGEKKKTTPFNILYSNTETLLPALYGATPKPIVQRRFKDADPTGRAAAMAGQRCLEFLLDTNIEDYEPFDKTMRDSVLDALLPGRGVARAKYEAEITPVPQEGVGQDGQPLPPVEKKTYETVCTEAVGWNRVYFGYARKWSKMPWIAFEHYMDRDEAAEKFPAAVVEKMVFTVNDEDRDEDGEKKKSREGESEERKTCLVYEIWKKKGRKVCFIAPNYPHGYLLETDDPLELSGFYPIPRPVQFLAKTDDLSPSALYLLYENQASELNKISVRINRIVEALKVRGAYDGSLGDTLDDLLKADDNTMLPATTASNIKTEGGLDKYIWFMPLDMLVAVLQELVKARNECKQIIYEVTGISDIIRGATDAEETATAQQIKNQWGSLRIKMLQNEVRRYVREMLRMMLEIAAKKFSPETFARMTGLPFVRREEKVQAQALMQAVQMQGQQTGMKLEQAPPEVQKQVAEWQQTLSAPDWESVIDLLKDDITRAYRIDIETNSTVEVNEMEDKKNISEALTAMSSFLEGVTPLVQAGVMPFKAAQSMLLSIVRKFRFGTEVEEEIKSMQPPQPKPDPKAEAEKVKAAAEQARTAADLEMQREKAADEKAQRALDAEFRREEHAQRMAELRAKAEYNEMMSRLKLLQLRAKVEAEERAAAIREKEMKAKPKEGAEA